MSGLYLIALLVSLAGILVIDARFRLAFWTAPIPTGIAVLGGTLFFLAWDAVGIASGVFVRGDSPLLLSIDLFPHMPVEEPVFLAFLCHLTLVAHAGARRIMAARRARGTATSGDAA